MRAAIAGIIALICWCPTANAMKDINSQTYQFDGGICDSTDQVYAWRVNGSPAPNGGGADSYKILSWVTSPAHVVGFMLTRVNGAGNSMWWGIGSTFTKDTMLRTRKDEKAVWFPPGAGMPLPGSRSSSQYLDLHGSCTGNGGVGFFMDIFYVYD